MEMDTLTFSLSIGLLNAVGFTIFQLLTLDKQIDVRSYRFGVGLVLNLIYGYLLWVNFRAIQNSSFGIQLIMAIGSTFVSWLAFAVISRTNDDLNISRRQVLGFAVGVLLTAVDELNKRFILNM